MTVDVQQAAGEPASKTRLRLWLRLLKATRRVEAELRERFRTEFGSTLPRFDVMAALSRHPEGLKMSALSGVLRVSNGNVTVVVDRLVEDGFVTREKVPGDRRAALARLTQAGMAEFARQAAAHEAWIDALFHEVPRGRAERLAALLAEVAEAAGEEKDG